MRKVFFIMLVFCTYHLILATFPGVIKTRQNYYTNEEKAELLIVSESGKYDEIQLFFRENKLIDAKFYGESPYRIPFSLQKIPIGNHDLLCILKKENETKEVYVSLKKLKPNFNEVKIDYYTQSLVVHDLPFIPFGFYNYWPVQPTLAEEEVVKGFNMMSPYQKIEHETLEERRNYMDRCAELGIKVNYNLCSLGGGGGVGSNRFSLSEDEIIEKLIEEVLEFKDHPALLSWYIADEPGLNRVDPKLLKRTYDVIHKLDPYHPVTIVFMHYEKAKQYYEAMDIVMADPYPIPQGSVTKAQSVIKKLHQEFLYEKPVWIVPQAFGGNEWWPREPTKQEIRIMTYLAILEQATGVQYFIRSGLNAFPKSTYTWAECGAIAHEIAEITPYLTQYDEVQQIATNPSNILAKQWNKNGKSLLIVANTNNEPTEYVLKLPNISETSAQVLFENRSIELKKNELKTFIGAYGTQVYEIGTGNYENGIHPKNIILDPSFEMNPSVGVPSNCYVTIRGDKGATYFIDSRIAHHGDHSIRLTCPSEENGTVLKFYRQRLQQNRTYTLSIWAKALPSFNIEEMESRVTGFWNRILHFFKTLFRAEKKRNVLRLRIDDVAEEFDLSQEWQQYSIRTSMKDTIENTKIRNPFVQMTGIGTSWVDLLELVPDLEMEEFLQMENQQIEIRIHSNHDRGRIYYRLINENERETDYILYEKPIFIKESTLLQAKLMDDEDILGEIQKEMYFHKAVGAKATYRFPYAANYDGGGKQGLVNAKFATTNYKNKNWQGFIAKNLDVELDLRTEKEFSQLKIGFLHDIHAWIFLPTKISLYTSEDGTNYTLFHEYENTLPMQNPDRFVKRFELHFSPLTSRYIKVVAESMKQAPDWHKGAGGGIFLFVDEIEIN